MPLWLASSLVVCLASPELSAEPCEQRTAEARGPEAAAPDANARRVELFPSDRLYSRHLADPGDPGMGVEWLALSEPGVPQSGDTRFQLSLGGIFGIVRFRPARFASGGVELGVLAGFDAQFDVDESYDNLGWDGLYGLVISASAGGPWALRAGLKHTSSHVGDEYAERTGRRRIGYTREELVAAVARRFGACCRAYFEGGFAYDLRNDELQEPGRWQLGIEVEPPPRLFGGRAGWYAAADATAFEESDWDVDWSAQAGLLFPARDRRWRVAVTYRNGRVPIGELFQHRESWIGAGLLLDL